MSETENREEQAGQNAGVGAGAGASANAGAGVGDASPTAAVLGTGASETEDGLLSRIELIESQPLSHRAQGFEQVHDELLAELQRGDHGGV